MRDAAKAAAPPYAVATALRDGAEMIAARLVFSMEPMMGRWSIPYGVVFELCRAWSNHVSPAIVRPLL